MTAARYAASSGRETTTARPKMNPPPLRYSKLSETSAITGEETKYRRRLNSGGGKSDHHASRSRGRRSVVRETARTRRGRSTGPRSAGTGDQRTRRRRAEL